MSLIDDTFAPVPKRILNDWGQNITYIKTTTPRTYDPATGAVTGDDTSVTVRAVISRLSPREAEGLYQTTDVRILFGTEELGDYYPTEADRIQYPQAGVTREAKIIDITTYRGDKPVYHTIIARPQ
jgi:hypothetical protein